MPTPCSPTKNGRDIFTVQCRAKSLKSHDQVHAHYRNKQTRALRLFKSHILQTNQLAKRFNPSSWCCASFFSFIPSPFSPFPFKWLSVSQIVEVYMLEITDLVLVPPPRGWGARRNQLKKMEHGEN